jgi:A/G-specific adenine glycosylase
MMPLSTKPTGMVSDSLSRELLNWWETNKREYVWRKTRDSYSVLVSEVLLHRTRADQVAKIFCAFMKRYPTAKSLARARTGEVVRLLRPLGLRWRAKLLVKMAREIEEQYHGSVPRDLESLKSLPGVGDYIASAFLSLEEGRPVPILDTNTVRIVGRVFGKEVSDSSRRSDRFRLFYSSLQDPSRPRDFNLAMIDLGALICHPTNPQCHVCPISTECEYGRMELRAQ